MNINEKLIAASDPDYYYNQMRAAGLVFESPLQEMEISSELLNMVSKEDATKYVVLPISYENGLLTLVTANSSTLKQKAELADRLRCKIKIMITTEFNIRNGLIKFYNVDDVSHRNAFYDSSTSVFSALKMKLDTIIHDAAVEKASDIHILPTNGGLSINFRINGHLVDKTSVYQIKKEDIDSFTNLIWQCDNKLQYKKNMANDGSFSTMVNGTVYFVRISTIPVASINVDDNWHKSVLRLLPQDRSTQSLEDLKYPDDVLKAIRRTLLQNANGMILMAGETGSGKTTSLYAMIDEQLKLKGEMQNVCTIENPVEIHDNRYTQCQVRTATEENISMTPTKILQSLLRQDPDIILYGEIRSRDDAEKTIEAATTGHKVFSTVHASNCVSTIVRLLDLGVPRSSMLGQLNMIISQRLLSPLCPDCSKSHILTDIEKSVLSKSEVEAFTKGINGVLPNLRERGSGLDISRCKNKLCRNGYLKRQVVPEFIEFDDELRDALMNSAASFTATNNVLKQRGFKSMWDRVYKSVFLGKIELKEALTKIGRAKRREE